MTLELSQKSLAWLFIASLIMGFAAGAFYDLLRLRRKITVVKGVMQIIITSFEDICFFTLWSAAFCILLYAKTYGVVRIEAIFSQFLGFFIYRKTLAIPIEKISNILAAKIKKITAAITNKFKTRKKRKKRKERHKNERTR